MSNNTFSQEKFTEIAEVVIKGAIDKTIDEYGAVYAFYGDDPPEQYAKKVAECLDITNALLLHLIKGLLDAAPVLSACWRDILETHE
jgi:hypothetical protein